MDYNLSMTTPHTANNAIKAVIFDWGGVLEPLPDAAHFALREGQLGLPAGSLAEILWGPVWEQLEVGAISGEIYESHVCARCGFRDHDELEAFYQAFYPQQIQPEMLAAVAALRPRYRVALLTNAFAGQREHITRVAGAAPDTLFDAYINSAEVGMRKPTPAIYHHALERLGVQAAEAVFIDDLPRNVEAASALGLSTILHRDPTETLAALSALLGHSLSHSSG
jgi:epoxide hydrolase-like predicted phosphatase